MLMVKTKIKPSKTHGMGLFADQDIKKGTVTWRFMLGMDLVVPQDILLQISEAARVQFLNYCYVDKYTKNFILCFDDSRFINHSENPNVIQNDVESEELGVEMAARDIKKGEELLCNYYDFDFDAHRKLHKLDIYKYTKEESAQIKNFIEKLFEINSSTK